MKSLSVLLFGLVALVANTTASDVDIKNDRVVEDVMAPPQPHHKKKHDSRHLRNLNELKKIVSTDFEERVAIANQASDDTGAAAARKLKLYDMITSLKDEFEKEGMSLEVATGTSRRHLSTLDFEEKVKLVLYLLVIFVLELIGFEAPTPPTIIEGSTTPISGPTGLTFDFTGCAPTGSGFVTIGNINSACSLPTSYECMPFLTGTSSFSTDYYITYFPCLFTEAAGPVTIGPDGTNFWWFNKDVGGGSFVFEGDEACGTIDETASCESGTTADCDGRTKFELWYQPYKNKRLDEFVGFSVDYNVVNLGATENNEGYVNMYLRADAGNMEFYDCRLTYYIPGAGGSPSGVPAPGDTGTITFGPDTVSLFTGAFSGSTIGCNIPGSSPPTDVSSIAEYLTYFPNAVMGVDGAAQEFYTFTLETGSSGFDNSNLKTCWSNVDITTNDSGTPTENRYAFAELALGSGGYRRRQLQY